MKTIRKKNTKKRNKRKHLSRHLQQRVRLHVPVTLGDLVREAIEAGATMTMSLTPITYRVVNCAKKKKRCAT